MIILMIIDVLMINYDNQLWWWLLWWYDKYFSDKLWWWILWQLGEMVMIIMVMNRSSLGSFYIPCIVMVVLYSRIFKVKGWVGWWIRIIPPMGCHKVDQDKMAVDKKKTSFVKNKFSFCSEVIVSGWNVCRTPLDTMSASQIFHHFHRHWNPGTLWSCNA